jgi:CarboxypepD_reg-like domain/Secretion system C-terminal sorting domain
VGGRAFPDQLERDIMALPKKKKYWQWYYMLSAVLFFMKPAKTKAQGSVIMLPDTTYPVYTIRFDGGEEKSKKEFVKAIVTDAAGNPIPFASVKIVGTDRGTSADETGSFSLVREGKEMVLEISALNYETRQVFISKENNEAIVLQKSTKELKEVVVVAFPATLRGNVRISGMMRSSQVRTNVFKDTIMNIFSPSFSIYPNPVPKGSSFTISIKLKETGNLTIRINDAGGRLITGKKINAITKEWKEQFTAGSAWSGGLYYVKIINDKGILLNTGSLVVQ